MDRSTPRPRPVPGAIVGYVNGRPVRVIAGGSGEDDPAPAPAPQAPEAPAAPAPAPAPAAPAPTPADLAARHAAKADDPGDVEEQVTVTQKRLSLMLTREKDQGRQAALRALATDAGLDPDTIDATQIKQILAEGKALKDAQLSDEQRREADYTQREQAIAAKEAETAKALAAAQAQLAAAHRTSALLGLGASGADLEDALALLDKALKDTPSADAEAVAEAAKDLQKRRPGLFGTPEPIRRTATPPAPSGSPAGGPPQRQTPVGKPGDAGRDMARRMFPTDTAA